MLFHFHGVARGWFDFLVARGIRSLEPAIQTYLGKGFTARNIAHRPFLIALWLVPSELSARTTCPISEAYQILPKSGSGQPVQSTSGFTVGTTLLHGLDSTFWMRITTKPVIGKLVAKGVFPSPYE